MQNRAILALAALAPFVAAQSVTITSNCDFPIYLWNVVNSYGAGPPTFTLDSDTPTWSSPYENKNSGGGASIKLKLNQNIFDGGPLSQVEYKMTSDTLFYDWSLINGAPLAGQLFTMSTSNPSCPTLTCEQGNDYCPGAYYHPDDVATLGCNGNADLIVTICGAGSSSGSSGSGSSGSGSSSSAPSSSPAPPPSSAAPAPATTSAPSVGGGFLEGESNDGVPQMATEILTTIVPVTVTKHLPAATAAVEAKREAHLHAHAHRMADKVAGRHYHA